MKKCAFCKCEFKANEDFQKHMELEEKLRQLSEEQASVKIALVRTLPDYVAFGVSGAGLRRSLPVSQPRTRVPALCHD